MDSYSLWLVAPLRAEIPLSLVSLLAFGLVYLSVTFPPPQDT